MGLTPNNRMKALRLPVSVEVNLMVQSQTVKILFSLDSSCSMTDKRSEGEEGEPVSQ